MSMATVPCEDCQRLTAGKCWRHSSSQPVEGLATKVRTGQGTYGLSWVMPVCHECGAVLADQKTHDEWHERHET